MNKLYFLKENKYIRLKIDRPTMPFRASISINKYYEINFMTFHPYDYKDEKEALEKAKNWLEIELKKFQEGLNEKEYSVA